MVRRYHIMTILNTMKNISRKTSLLAVAGVVTASLSFGVVSANSIPSGTNNNPIPRGAEICDLNVGFIIDRSNSIRNDSEQNPQIITDAVSGVVSELQGTETQVAVWSFGTKATGYSGPNPLPDSPDLTTADYPGIGFTPVNTADGVNTINQTVASIPYASADSERNERRAGWTNWEAALVEANANGSTPSDADIVFMITDGEPTLPYTGDNEPPTDEQRAEAATAGVQAADAVKADGNTRIVGFAVGHATEEQEYIDNMQRITGGLNTATEGDDYFTGNFSQLGTMLADAIEQACNGEEPTPPAPKPEPEEPEALPVTGAGGVIAAVTGVSAVSAAVHSVVTKRRNR